MHAQARLGMKRRIGSDFAKQHRETCSNDPLFRLSLDIRHSANSSRRAPNNHQQHSVSSKTAPPNLRKGWISRHTSHKNVAREQACI